MKKRLSQHCVVLVTTIDLPLTAYFFCQLPLPAYFKPLAAYLKRISAGSIHPTADSISKQFETIGKYLNHLDILRGQVLRKLSYLIDKILLNINLTDFFICSF